MSWILDLSILLSICRVYIPGIYVWLVMSSYLLFGCIYFVRCLMYHMLSKTRRNSINRSLLRVIPGSVYLVYSGVSTLMLGVSHAVEVLVLGVLVVV